MTQKNKTPDTVGTVAGATKFQQSKRILTLARRSLLTIVFTKTISLGDLLAVLVLVGVLA